MFSCHNPITGTETLLDKFGTVIDIFPLELLPHYGDGNLILGLPIAISIALRITSPLRGRKPCMGGFTINSTAPLELLPHCGDGNCNIHITHFLSPL